MPELLLEEWGVNQERDGEGHSRLRVCVSEGQGLCSHVAPPGCVIFQARGVQVVTDVIVSRGLSSLCHRRSCPFCPPHASSKQGESHFCIQTAHLIM